MKPANKKTLVPTALALLAAMLSGPAALGQCPDADSDGNPGSIIVPGQLEVNEAAALEGSCGLEVMFDGTGNDRFVESRDLNLETVYRGFFRINLNDFDMLGATPKEKEHLLFLASAVGPLGQRQAIRIIIRKRAGAFRVRAQAMQTNSKKKRTTDFLTLDPAAGPFVDHTVEFEWMAAPGAGQNGLIRISVDGGAQSSEHTGVKNAGQEIFAVSLGARFVVDPASTGSYYLDDFQSFRTLAP